MFSTIRIKRETREKLKHFGGLRVSEVYNLDREDIDFEEFTISVRNTKNRVDRTVVVTEKCIRAIEQYLETRIDTEKPLFLSRKRRRISTRELDFEPLPRESLPISLGVEKWKK